MPNLLLDQRVIPELVMNQANPKTIADCAISILKDHKRQDEMKKSFAKLKNKLGSPGVISSAAKSISEFSSL